MQIIHTLNLSDKNSNFLTLVALVIVNLKRTLNLQYICLRYIRIFVLNFLFLTRMIHQLSATKQNPKRILQRRHIIISQLKMIKDSKLVSCFNQTQQYFVLMTTCFGHFNIIRLSLRNLE
jgi:hypothetical protein